MAHDQEVPPDYEPAIRVVAMPADTNSNGDIFGGWLMSLMDSAGGAAAALETKGRVVTVAVDAMSFLHPVKIGDIVSVYASVLSVGRTSLKIDISAWRRLRDSHVSMKVTQATFTFVAICDDGKPRVVAR